MFFFVVFVNCFDVSVDENLRLVDKKKSRNDSGTKVVYFSAFYRPAQTAKQNAANIKATISHKRKYGGIV